MIISAPHILLAGLFFVSAGHQAAATAPIVIEPVEPDATIATDATSPPPEYTNSPSSPSCSSPPAWADEDLWWKDLSTDQHNAAVYLGYTSDAWDTCNDTAIESKYAEYDWSDLSFHEQLAFSFLGYNKGSYANFYFDYFFQELPLSVKVAATALGYNQTVWDECAEEVCVEVDNFFWKGLGKQKRINLKVLGYDCWTWNNYNVTSQYNITGNFTGGDFC